MQSSMLEVPDGPIAILANYAMIDLLCVRCLRVEQTISVVRPCWRSMQIARVVLRQLRWRKINLLTLLHALNCVFVPRPFFVGFAS